MNRLVAVFTALAACWCALSAAGTPSAGGTARVAPPPGIRFFGDAARADASRADASDSGDGPVLQGREKRLRRFEIVFVTSLPASVLLSLLGIVAYRGVAGRTGDFSAAEYRTLALSAAGISLGIAVSDSLKTARGTPHRRGRR